jgi:hypothetical protein
MPLGPSLMIVSITPRALRAMPFAVSLFAITSYDTSIVHVYNDCIYRQVAYEVLAAKSRHSALRSLDVKRAYRGGGSSSRNHITGNA